MTVWLDSMRFPDTGLPDRSMHEVPPVQSSDSNLDAEARRLAAGVARGNEKTFQELYDRYQERLFRLGLVLGRGNSILASEMVQSVFVIAAAKLRAVESEEHLWNWLARVGRQQIIKMQRRTSADVANLSLEQFPDGTTASPDHVLEETLDGALAEMEANDRQIVEWFYFDGLSHQQIAERLGLTTKAVSNRLDRARAWLRTRVQRSLSDEL